MTIRDRIVELRRVRAGDLQAHPRNWRLHPEVQRTALRAMLDEVGYASALLARVRDDGMLELVDGHLRAETTPDEEVPVLVLDVSEAEADKLLATIDPLAALATTDDEALAALLARIATDSDDVQKLLDGLVGEVAADVESVQRREGVRIEPKIPQLYQVIVDCRDEAEQRDVYELLIASERRCRLVML